MRLILVGRRHGMSYARPFLALLVAASFVGCAAGQPATIERGAARQSVAPVSTLGFRPEVQATLAIPIDTAACLTGFLMRGTADAIQTAHCVLNTLVPVVQPPAPSAASSAAGCVTEETTTVTTKRLVPAAAPAPRATNCPEPPPAPIACAGGTCGLPK